MVLIGSFALNKILPGKKREIVFDVGPMVKFTRTAVDKFWGVCHEQLSKGKLIYLLLTSQRELHLRPLSSKLAREELLDHVLP